MPRPEPRPEPGPDQSPIVEALEVSSLDGAAVLTIPAGALPAGVGPDDVSITDITAEAAALTEGTTLLAAYELRPSGLQFPEPVTLTVHLGQAHPTTVITLVCHGHRRDRVALHLPERR